MNKGKLLLSRRDPSQSAVPDPKHNVSTQYHLGARGLGQEAEERVDCLRIMAIDSNREQGSPFLKLGLRPNRRRLQGPRGGLTLRRQWADRRCQIDPNRAVWRFAGAVNVPGRQGLN